MTLRVYYSRLFVFAVLVLIASCLALAYGGESQLQDRAEKLISEGALLEPISAYGERIHYVADIGGGYICGITHARLMTFSKDNINNVVGSYWLPTRSMRVFGYYKGHVYLLGSNRYVITIFDV
ncbi:MAG: hypothetical protein ACYSWP_16110, partial [Planctomycetota bacterium]